MARQMLYVDSIIGSLAERMDYLRSERGDLTANNASVATVVYDVLNWIGLTDGAIRMVLGADADSIQGDPVHSVPCSICDAPAEWIAQTDDGYRLVCNECADEIRAAEEQ